VVSRVVAPALVLSCMRDPPPTPSQLLLFRAVFTGAVVGAAVLRVVALVRLAVEPLPFLSCLGRSGVICFSALAATSAAAVASAAAMAAFIR
jgi:hypothetical protein